MAISRWPFALLFLLVGLISCNSDSPTSERANNINRAEFMCDVQLSMRLKLSADADFQYSDAHASNSTEYLIIGSFKDGSKHGRFSCVMQYLGSDHWTPMGLRVFWPGKKPQILVKMTPSEH